MGSSHENLSNRFPGLGGAPDVPPATLRRTPVPTVAAPEMVQLQGMISAENIGGYSLSYGMGQFGLSVVGSNPSIGGSYMIGALPIGVWFVFMDRQGFALPVAVQRLGQDSFYVRVDPAPLRGLGALTSMPGY